MEIAVIDRFDGAHAHHVILRVGDTEYHFAFGDWGFGQAIGGGKATWCHYQ